MCILIVENEPITLLATATWLEDAGFTVIAVHDGLQAVDLLEQHPGYFTALITDFHMPFVTGADVVMSMRRNYPGIPMIITTAVSQAVTQDWQLQYGVDVLFKPNTVHFAILMAALKSMRVVGCGVRGRNG